MPNAAPLWSWLPALTIALLLAACGRDEDADDDACADAVDDSPEACDASCEGDFTVGSAADMDMVRGCREITGSLSVLDPGLESLSALQCLEEVGGDLSIGGAVDLSQVGTPPEEIGPTHLCSLAGLDRLERVGGTLRIGVDLSADWMIAAGTPVGPVALTSLDGAPALTSIGGLEIGSTYELGSGAWSTIPLTDLSELDGVTVGGDVDVRLDVPPASLPAIGVADGASITLGGAGLVDASAPSWPASLEHLTISETALSSLAGMERVLEVGSLTLTGNPQLSDLSGLGVTKASSLVLDTEGVTPAGALRITDVTGSVTVTGDTTALAHLTRAVDLAVMPGSHATSRLDGLGSLVELTEATLWVEGQADLSDLAALSSVRRLEITGGLTSVRGLSDGITIDRFALYRSEVASLSDLPAGTGISDLELYENPELASLEGLEDLRPSAPYIVENPKLAQCEVDAWLAARGLPFDDRIANGVSSGNAIGCTCDAEGRPTCPDPRCEDTLPGSISLYSAADVATLAEVECADLVYVFDGPRDLSLPKLVSAEMIILASASTHTVSLPALERVGRLRVNPQSPDGGQTPIERVDLPALTDAFDILISAPDDLVSFEAPKLARIVDFDLSCEGKMGTTPISTLELGGLEAADSVVIRGCTELAECAVEADLAAATIETVELVDLNATCTCDEAGGVAPGSCG